MKITVVPYSGKTIEFENIESYDPNVEGFLQMRNDDGSLIWYAKDEIEYFRSDLDEDDNAEYLGSIEDESV